MPHQNSVSITACVSACLVFFKSRRRNGTSNDKSEVTRYGHVSKKKHSYTFDHTERMDGARLFVLDTPVAFNETLYGDGGALSDIPTIAAEAHKRAGQRGMG